MVNNTIPVFIVIIVSLIIITSAGLYLVKQTGFVGDEFIDVFPERTMIEEKCVSTTSSKECISKNLKYIIDDKIMNDINPIHRSVKFENVSLETSSGVSNVQEGIFLHLQGASATITHDFRGQRTKILGTTIGGFSLGDGSHQVIVSDQRVCNFGDIGLNLANIRSTQPTNFVLEIEPSELNSSQYKIFCNGVQFGRVFNIKDTEVLNVNFVTTGHLYLRRVSYLPAFSCKLVGDEKLGIESFTGGRVIDKFSGRFEMKRFCLQQPIIRTNQRTSGSDQITEPLLLLNQGKRIEIPGEETWTIVYVFDGKNVQTKCDFEREAINKDLKCESVNGIVQLGCDGFIDEKRNVCVTTPSQGEKNCGIGQAIELTENGSIRCTSYKPVDQICSPLSLKKTANDSVCEPKESFTCPIGYEVRVIANKQYSCEKTLLNEIVNVPLSKVTNSENVGLNLSLGIFTVVILLLIIFLFFGTWLKIKDIRGG